MAQQDVTIQGATYPGVPGIEVPKAGGGTAYFADISDTDTIVGDVRSGKYFYLANGTKATGTAVLATATVANEKLTLTDGFPVSVASGLEYVTSFPDLSVTLADTSYSTWTPSTTAMAILSGSAVGTFTATNLANNDYWSRVRIFVDVRYTTETVTKGTFFKCIAENWYGITRRPNNKAQFVAGTRPYNVVEAVANTWVINYYNTSDTVGFSSSYGFYPGNSAPTLSSTSSASPTVTVKNPIINAKCNASYFSTTMAGNVDQTASTIKMKFDIFRQESGYCRSMVWDSLIDIWQNGL